MEITLAFRVETLDELTEIAQKLQGKHLTITRKAAAEVVPAPPVEPTAEVVPAPPVEPDADAEVVPAPPVEPDAGAEVDARGIPFDPRIHARTKVKKANGEWRMKRNVDKALVGQVEAELKGADLAPPPPPAPDKPVELMTFKDFMTLVKGAGYDTIEKMNTLAQGLGLTSIAILATKPELIPDAVKYVTENA